MHNFCLRTTHAGDDIDCDDQRFCNVAHGAHGPATARLLLLELVDPERKRRLLAR